MATATIVIGTGTISAPQNLPLDGDGTTLEALAVTTGTTAATTGDLDSSQSIALTANSFEALNQFAGIMAKTWSCSGRSAIVRIVKMYSDMLQAPNSVPTGG